MEKKDIITCLKKIKKKTKRISKKFANANMSITRDNVLLDPRQ